MSEGARALSSYARSNRVMRQTRPASSIYTINFRFVHACNFKEAVLEKQQVQRWPSGSSSARSNDNICCLRVLLGGGPRQVECHVTA